MPKGQTPTQRLRNQQFARNEERKKGKSPSAAAKYQRGSASAKKEQSKSKVPWSLIVFVGILLLGSAFYQQQGPKINL